MSDVTRNLWTALRRALIPAGLIVGALASQGVLAAHPDLASYWCAEDVSNVGNCTANEVSIASVVSLELVGDPPSCEEGSTLTLQTLTVQLDANTGTRYDVTIWIGKEGNDPRELATETSCKVTALPENTGSQYILHLEDPPDQCLDLQQPPAPIQLTLAENTDLVCADSDGDGTADMQVLITWWQNENFACGTGDDSPPFSLQDPYFSPGAPSKCDYTVIPLGIPFNVNLDISVDKATTTTEITAAGQTVDYSYTVTNTGEGELTNVTLSDSRSDATPSCVPAQPATLAPDASMTCTAEYTVTPDDMAFETEICNTATADSDETNPAFDDECVPVVKEPPPPPPPPEVIPVPTLSEWMLALLAMLTLGVGLYAGRARRGRR